MVVIDKFSKRTHFIPTTSETTAHGTAQLFFDTVWKAHGLPSAKIISDRDSKFTSGFWQTLWNETFGNQTVNVHCILTGNVRQSRTTVAYDSHVRRTGSTDTIASSWRQLAVLDMVSYKIPIL